MMNYDGKEVIDDYRELFGSEPTVAQMRWIVNVIKHCRGRCRSNAALNNWLNRNFQGRTFREVDAVNERTGEKFKKLEIT